ncbi:MAG TPA: hypothetical protein VKI44_35510, partial [Acetobacteraceae bacterium]|nr:hypothetical protein [Acetobacteraceae bacterium]
NLQTVRAYLLKEDFQQFWDYQCTRHIEMTPLCKVEVTLPRVSGSREVRRAGGVDEQARVQPP